MYSGMTPKALEWQKKTRKFVSDELIPWEVHAEMNKGELPEEIETETSQDSFIIRIIRNGHIKRERGTWP